MRDKRGNEQISEKDMECAPAHDRSWREPGFDPDVKEQLQPHAAREQPSVEIARIAQAAFIESL